MSGFTESEYSGASQEGDVPETLGSILQGPGAGSGAVPVEFALGEEPAAPPPARRASPIVVLIIGMAGSGKVGLS